MRFIVVTLASLLALVLFLALTDQLDTFTERLWGDPQELDLKLTDLHPDMERERFLEGLDPDRFFCTDDTRQAGREIGERACFTSVARVDGLHTQYLGLFFDEDEGLAAMNLVLAEDGHETNLERIRAHLGDPTQRVNHDGVAWMAWERDHGLFVTPEEKPEGTEVSLQWFRERDLMERLLETP